MRTLLLLLIAASAWGQASSAYLAVGNSSSYTDSIGQVWAADNTGACTGTAFSTGTPISGTVDDTLYQKGRYGNNISCTATLAAGVYTITLKFADVRGYTAPGQQVFNIFVNGALQKANFDIFGTIRAQNVAYDIAVTYALLTTGAVSVQAQQVTGGAQLQAISWVQTGGGGGGGVTSINSVSGPITIAESSPVDVTTGGTTVTVACPTCVTAGAALPANRVLVGQGGQAAAALSSAGTSSQVLHGGTQTYGPVDLTAEVTGVLPAANGGSPWLLSGSNTYYDAGDVGVGTPVPPVTRLQVQQSTDAVLGGLAITNAANVRSMLLWMDASDVAHIDNATVASRDIAINSGGTGKLGVNTATPAYSLDVAGTARATRLIGIGASDEFKPEDYVFTRTNGTSASASPDLGTAGVRVITLTPCPSGVNADAVNHSYVRISGGTGTAETPLITAFGAGTDCTITVTTANAHTGSWVVSNNGDGLQEALILAADASVARHAVRLGGGYFGYYRTWKPVWVPGYVAIYGAGPGISVLQSQDSAQGVLDAVDGHNTFEGFGITNLGNTQGSSGNFGIRLGSAGTTNSFTTMRNLFFDFLYADILSVNATQCKISDSTFYNPSYVGVLMANPLGPDSNGCIVTGNNFFSYVNITPADSFIRVESTSSVVISNNTMIATSFTGPTADVNYCINNVSTASGGWINITGNKCEAAGAGGVRVYGTWTQTAISGNTIGNSGTYPQSNWNAVDLTGTGTQSRIALTGNVVQCDGVGANNGVLLQGTYSTATVASNQILACNFGVNGNGTPSTTLVTGNNITGSLTSPIFVASTGITVDATTPATTYATMINTVNGTGNAANGSRVYCSDCTIASPCAGGGTGALAKKLNGAWVCN